jgi:hypothetical protein
MIIKVDKILLDSQLVAGMIGGVSSADPAYAWNVEVTSAIAISATQRSSIHHVEVG